MAVVFALTYSAKDYILKYFENNEIRKNTMVTMADL